MPNLTAPIPGAIDPGTNSRAPGSTDPQAQRFNNAGFALFGSILSAGTRLSSADGNVVFCPISLLTSTEALRLGSTDRTADELASLLAVQHNRLPAARPAALRALEITMGRGKSPFKTATAFWLGADVTVKEPFREELSSAFGTTITSVNFSKSDGTAAEIINDWTRETVDASLQNIVSAQEAKPGTKFAVTDAAYFKGTWIQSFNADATRSGPFRRFTGGDVLCKMMTGTHLAHYGEVDGVRVLRLPYSAGRLSLCLLLPPPGAESFTSLESDISADWIESAVSLTPEKMLVDITMPRFAVEQTVDATLLLRSLNVKSAFDPNTASLKKVAELKAPLSVNFLRQQARFMVDEAGMAAAPVQPAARGAKRAAFRADRPFLFVVRDDASGLVLMMGKLMSP